MHLELLKQNQTFLPSFIQCYGFAFLSLLK